MKTLCIHFINNNKIKIKLDSETIRDLTNKLQSSGFNMVSSHEQYQIVINWRNVDYIEIDN